MRKKVAVPEFSSNDWEIPDPENNVRELIINCGGTHEIGIALVGGDDNDPFKPILL